ncbi:MAG: UDP-GlcNAc--UDP-phosphate GlcNAc-1-phosphate transferase [Bacteroidota bacterium]
MLVAGIFLILFTVEYFYFKVAEHFNITDTPNQRSSHTIPTIRGGGIIFPISIFIYYLVFGWKYSFFAVGLLGLTIISFADDIKHQRRRTRIVIQLLAAVFLLIDASLPIHLIPVWIAALIIIPGMINACNFMDGINGMTALYSFSVMIGLFFVNNLLHAFDEMLLVCLALSNLVFSYFNCRKIARSFAGDAGSISMAYILLFLTTTCIVITKNPIFLLFFTVYIVDVVFTILQRLYKKEAIFEGHRKHLFQYLANELQMPHIMVSSIFMFIQLLITGGVVFIWQKEVQTQRVFTGITISVIIVLYLIVKKRIAIQVRKLKMNATPYLPLQ